MGPTMSNPNNPEVLLCLETDYPQYWNNSPSCCLMKSMTAWTVHRSKGLWSSKGITWQKLWVDPILWDSFLSKLCHLFVPPVVLVGSSERGWCHVRIFLRLPIKVQRTAGTFHRDLNIASDTANLPICDCSPFQQTKDTIWIHLVNICYQPSSELWGINRRLVKCKAQPACFRMLCAMTVPTPAPGLSEKRWFQFIGAVHSFPEAIPPVDVLRP